MATERRSRRLFVIACAVVGIVAAIAGFITGEMRPFHWSQVIPPLACVALIVTQVIELRKNA